MSSTSEKVPVKRGYRLGARAEALRRTREEILDAAERAFDDRWYDEVTLADVAREAGVAQQTVVNHFGSKENLYLCGVTERFGPRVQQARAAVRVGDVASVAAVVVADYEQTGVSTMRTLALAARHPHLAGITETGRAVHRDWVATALAPRLAGLGRAERARVVGVLATVLDVRTWHQLRHDERRSPAETRRDLRRLVDAVLPPHPD